MSINVLIATFGHLEHVVVQVECQMAVLATSERARQVDHVERGDELSLRR